MTTASRFKLTTTWTDSNETSITFYGSEREARKNMVSKLATYNLELVQVPVASGPIGMSDIDFTAECLGCVNQRDGVLVVRSTRDGLRFAVISCYGAAKRIVKTFQTSDHARNYMLRIASY